MALGILEAYDLLRAVGFDEADAINMTAIGMAESGLDPAAIGDVSLEDRTWGPSVGMFQERTLKAEMGRATIRDEHWLLESPLNQCKAAYQTSNGGKYLVPWSTWQHGSAEAHLSEVRSVVGSAHQPPPTHPTTNGADMLVATHGVGKPTVLKSGVWTTLELANPFSILTGPAEVVNGQLYLSFSDLAEGSSVQVRPYNASLQKGVWVFTDSLGIDEREGTAGSTFIKSMFNGTVGSGQRLRVQATVTGQPEAHMTSASYHLEVQK